LLCNADGAPVTRSFDPIELELLWRRLISMVDEAAAAMVRTSFSTLVRESYDFSCVITDARGSVAGPGEARASAASLATPLPEDGEAFPCRFFPPDQLAPGDVLITNDIWLGPGHLARHHPGHSRSQGRQAGGLQAPPRLMPPDIGGKIRRSPSPREVFEEGLQIPPMKMIVAARPTRDPGHHHPQERPHARSDDGRSVGAGRGARPDEDGPLRVADGGL